MMYNNPILVLRVLQMPPVVKQACIQKSQRHPERAVLLTDERMN